MKANEVDARRVVELLELVQNIFKANSWPIVVSGFMNDASKVEEGIKLRGLFFCNLEDTPELSAVIRSSDPMAAAITESMFASAIRMQMLEEEPK